MLMPCSATAAELRYDGGGTMSDDEVHAEQQRMNRLDSLMREDASALRDTLGAAGFDDLWTELHAALTAANEPGRTWEQAQASRAAAACCVLNGYIDIAVALAAAREARQ